MDICYCHKICTRDRFTQTHVQVCFTISAPSFTIEIPALSDATQWAAAGPATKTWWLADLWRLAHPVSRLVSRPASSTWPQRFGRGRSKLGRPSATTGSQLPSAASSRPSGRAAPDGHQLPRRPLRQGRQGGRFPVLPREHTLRPEAWGSGWTEAGADLTFCFNASQPTNLRGKLRESQAKHLSEGGGRPPAAVWRGARATGTRSHRICATRIPAARRSAASDQGAASNSVLLQLVRDALDEVRLLPPHRESKAAAVLL